MNDFKFAYNLQPENQRKLSDYISADLQELMDGYKDKVVKTSQHISETTRIQEEAADLFLKREKRYYELAEADGIDLKILDATIDAVLKQIASPSENHGLKCLQIPPTYVQLKGFEFGGFYGPKGKGSYYSGDADGIKLVGRNKAEGKNDFIIFTLDASGKSGPSDLVGKFALDAKVNLIAKSKKYTEPQELFAYVNSTINNLNERQGGEKLVTALCVKVLASKSVSDKIDIEYCNAGHEPGLVYRLHYEEFDKLRNTGNLPLGVYDNETLSSLNAGFSKSSSFLRKGDILLLYTDGLLDAKSEADYSAEADAETKNSVLEKKAERFCIERLRAIVKENALCHPQNLSRKIIDAIRLFSGKGNKTDDIAVLAMKFVGF